jgi:hypothetical protein
MVYESTIPTARWNRTTGTGSTSLFRCIVLYWYRQYVRCTCTSSSSSSSSPSVVGSKSQTFQTTMTTMTTLTTTSTVAVALTVILYYCYYYYRTPITSTDSYRSNDCTTTRTSSNSTATTATATETTTHRPHVQIHWDFIWKRIALLQQLLRFQLGSYRQRLLQQVVMAIATRSSSTITKRNNNNNNNNTSEHRGYDRDITNTATTDTSNNDNKITTIPYEKPKCHQQQQQLNHISNGNEADRDEDDEDFTTIATVNSSFSNTDSSFGSHISTSRPTTTTTNRSWSEVWYEYDTTPRLQHSEPDSSLSYSQQQQHYCTSPVTSVQSFPSPSRNNNNNNPLVASVQQSHPSQSQLTMEQTLYQLRKVIQQHQHPKTSNSILPD